MATSGTVLGNNVIVSGAQYARVRVEWQLAGQNVGGNYSTINWQGYVDFVGCDAQLDNGHVRSSVGDLYNNGGRVYNYAGNFSNHTVGMGSGSFNIGHDGAGNQNLYMQGDVAVFGSGTSNGNNTWALPNIARYSNITSFTVTGTTDEGFTLNATCDLSASAINFSIDNGVGYGGGGSGTSASQTYHNLVSGRTYSCYAHTINAASGLHAFSGNLTPTTLKQNPVFSFRVP